MSDTEKAAAEKTAADKLASETARLKAWEAEVRKDIEGEEAAKKKKAEEVAKADEEKRIQGLVDQRMKEEAAAVPAKMALLKEKEAIDKAAASKTAAPAPVEAAEAPASEVGETPAAEAAE